ncbi:MAG: ABC transporter ATP-binding protein [Bdellovibrionota bacterium]
MTKEFRKTLKTFYHYAKPYRKQFGLGVLALLAVDLLNALPPLILKGFIDQASLTFKGDKRYAPFLWLGVTYAVVALTQGVCRYLWRIFLIRASHRVAERVRNEYFAKLQRLPPSFYDKHPIGDLMTLATNDVEAIRFALGPGLLVFADAIFLLLALPPAMLWLSPKFTLITLAPMIALPFIIVKAQRLVHDRFEKVQSHFSRLSSFAQENIEGIRVVKAFVREWTQLDRFSQIGKEFVRLNFKLAKAQAIFEPSFLLTVSLGTVLLIVFAGNDVITGAVGLGTFVAFTRYLDQLGWPMMALGLAVTHYQRGKTSLARVILVLNEKEEASIAKPGAAAATRKLNPLAPLIEARNLTFTYPGQNKTALEDVSFQIKDSSRTAIVGPIGSGKSTVIRLLAGLYEIPEGMLFWKGHDVNDLSLEERRELLAVVPQEAFLFSETLAWNVSMGTSGAPAHEIKGALEKAGIGPESEDWGLNMVLGERGSNLSGGQKARVALARALNKPAAALILDDTLSSIDAETESRILNNLNLTRHKALIMVTHRFARLSSFDQILVFNQGKLTQMGSPASLSSTQGLYRRLLELQQMESALT